MVKFFIIIIFIILNSSNIIADEQTDIKKLSEAVGNIIGKNLDNLGFKLDIKNVLKGIKKGSQNKSSPMTEDECLNALAQIQLKENERIASQNLKNATNFLINNLEDENVIQIEDTKLQYKILKKGSEKKVESYHSPIVKMTGKYLDGNIFLNSEQTINLNEILPALQKAIVGMQLHEKRQIFIHPDLFIDQFPFHLNSLAIFDIEILDLDAKKDSFKEIANTKKIF